MDDATINSLKKLSTLDSCGDGGHFKGAVLIDFKKYDELPVEMRSHIGYDASRFLEEFREKVAMAWAEENEHSDRVNHSDKLAGLFAKAGFEYIHVEVINSEYCKKSCCYKLPWVIVTTKKGRIKLGWRKSVMNLDWSGSDITANGEILFEDQNVTKGKNYIHCWGEDKAVEYLKKLNSEG